MSASTPPQPVPTYIFKVPVAGDGAVGKTSLIVRFTQGTFSDTYKMTIGTSFAVRTVDFGNVVVKLQIWDLAGQPHFSGVRPLFYQGATGIVYVFSVTDRASFDHLPGWIEEAQKNAGGIAGILIGNKADLTDQRVVPREEAESYAANLGLTYIETSAKLDQNVGDAFRLIASTIIQRKWSNWAPAIPVTSTEVMPPVSTPEEPSEILAPPQVEEPTPPAPEIGEPVHEPSHEPIVPSTTEPEPAETEIPPALEPALEKTPEPFPLSEETAYEPEPISEQAPPPEPTEHPSLTPTPPTEPLSEVEEEVVEIEFTEDSKQLEDIVVEHKSISTLPEFVNVDLHSISTEEFKKRSIEVMRRLGVYEGGIFGTYLLGLIRQGQRDVVIESLENLQED